MNYTIFSPNKKNSGGLASFRVSKQKNKKDMWEERLFVEVVPQKEWAGSPQKTGYNPANKKCIMISPSEAGDILHTLDTKIPFESYHKNGETGTWIKAGSFAGSRKFRGRDGQEETHTIARFAFSVSCPNPKFYVGVALNPAEAYCLRVFLENYIKGAMGLEGAELAKKFKQDQKKKDGEPESKPSKSEPEAELEEEDAGIPF